jgi:uncharacterized protein
MAGRVVHFEVPFDDVERATGFYQDVFGWQITPMPEFDYHGVSTGPTGDQGMPTEPGYIGGGMFKRAPNFPSSPVIVIDVDDIDATLEQVAARGGSTIAKKMPVGAMGFAAYFTDPEGNVMGLWETASG